MTSRAGALVGLAAAFLSAAVATSACAGAGNENRGSPVEPTTAPATGENFPDIVDAEATLGSDGTWRFDVTVSSPYDTPERYADAWRIMSPAGDVLGIRELAHDHASEQPFTRSLDNVALPEEVELVIIEGRDLANGWGGKRFELNLDR